MTDQVDMIDIEKKRKNCEFIEPGTDYTYSYRCILWSDDPELGIFTSEKEIDTYHAEKRKSLLRHRRNK